MLKTYNNGFNCKNNGQMDSICKKIVMILYVINCVKRKAAIDLILNLRINPAKSENKEIADIKLLL